MSMWQLWKITPTLSLPWSFWKIRLIYRCPLPHSFRVVLIHPSVRLYLSCSLYVWRKVKLSVSDRTDQSLRSCSHSEAYSSAQPCFFFLFIPSSLPSLALWSSGDNCAGVWPHATRIKGIYSLPLSSLSLSLWMCVGVTGKLADALA